jgi:hypothetical protein
MFQTMATLGYCPPAMKKGVISVLYKGGKKRKDDPNSYRVVSLCSTILKLYEKVLINIIEDGKCLSLNPLQGGFQQNTSCMLTAFLARECIFDCKQLPFICMLS